MESLFATTTLYRFILVRINGILLDTSDVGELNKLIPDGYESDPIEEGYELIINEKRYKVNNICIFTSGLANRTAKSPFEVGQHHDCSMMTIIYLDEI
jgi:hypothetical protein